MSSSEVKRPSLLTWRFTIVLLVIAVLCTLLAQIFDMYTPTWANLSTAIGGNLPIVIMFLALIIGNLFPKRINSSQIALISAVASISIYHFLFSTPLVVIDNFVAARTAPAPYNEMIDWNWGPELQYIQQMLNGGIHDVPWRVWLPSLCWWMLFGFLWFLFYSSFLSIVRRRWIDIELLPYPASYQWTIPIIAAAPEKRLKGISIRADRRLSMLLLGIWVGFFYMWPPVLRFLVPWFPDIYGWSSAPYISYWLGAIDTTQIPAIGNKVVAMLVIPTNILDYLTATLIPLDVLLTAWITSLAMFISCQVAYYKGYYSGALSIVGIEARRNLMGSQPPFKFYAVHMGMGMSIIVFWLVLNWRYLLDTLRSAIRGPTEEEVEREAMPHRIAWMLFIMSVISLILMYYSVGVTLSGALVILLTAFLVNLSGARIFGLSFSGGPSSWIYLSSLTHFLFPNVTGAENITPEYVNTVYMANRPTQAVGNAPGIAMWFKIAKDVDIRARDMFIAMLIAIVVANVIAWPVIVKIYYSVGAAKTVRGTPESWWFPYLAEPSTWRSLPAVRPWWPHALAGAVIVGILSYLRMRFVWWPFDPVGAFIGINYAIVEPFSLFVAWLIKLLVIKFGGMRIHDEFLIPFAVGTIIGSALCWFVAGVAALPRYIE